jgi:RNA-binding protein YlmH
MAENVSQHFRPSESTFIDLAEGLIRQATDEYRPVLTNFLNPRQRYILETLVNRQDELRVSHFGGYDGAENARSLIYPSYHEPSLADYDMQALALNYPTKFAELHHSTILGALIHQGLARESFGDIVGADGVWQVITTRAMGAYIAQSLDHVGKTKVRFEPIDFGAVLTPDDDWDDINTTVSSLRLDNIVSNGYNISRTHSKEIIEHDLVRVNWTDINRPDYILAVNDVVSVRGFGRLKLVSEDGLTKKDKWRVTMSVIRK